MTGRVVGTLYTLYHFILLTTLWCRYYYYLHLTGQELWTGHPTTCPKSSIQLVSSRPGGCLILKPALNHDATQPPVFPAVSWTMWLLLSPHQCDPPPQKGNFEELFFFEILIPNFHSIGNPLGQRPLEFPPPGSLPWSSNKRTSYLGGLLLPWEKALQGLMQKEILLWMRHQFNLYLIKKVIHSCIQQPVFVKCLLHS